MAMHELHECITAGLPRDEALRIYAASVNKEDTLFTFIPTLPAKLAQMRELLHDPITVDEAYALSDVLYRRQKFTDMIAWLQDEPIAWDGYFARQRFRAEQADRQLLEDLRREEEERDNGITACDSGLSPERSAELAADAKRYYLPMAKPCPNCGTPPEFLEWSRYSTPQSPRGFFCGGWNTRCRFCLQVVNDVVEVMGTSRRRLSGPPSELWKNNVTN
jgi:hypothetical protein